MKAGWKPRKLSELLQIQSGYAFDAKDFSLTGEVPLIRIRDLKGGKDTETKFTGNFDPKYLVNAGDFLIGMDGEFGCYEWKGQPALLNQRVCRIQNFSTELVPRFLFYGINSHLKDIEAVTGFTTVKHLSAKQILNIDFLVPPPMEQHRVVGILDEAFNNIALAKANVEKNLKSARRLFESHLHSVLTPGTGLWSEKPFNELCDFKHGFAFKSEFFTTDGEYVLLTPGNFYEHGGYKDRGVKQKYYEGDIPSGYVLGEGDLLVAMTEQAAGLLGSPILVPEADKFLHNQRLGLVVPKAGVPWCNEFFFHVFNTQRVRREIHSSASGVKVRHTSPSKMGEIVVAFPHTIAEQKTTASKLNAHAIESERLESIYKKKLESLDDLKKSILYQAFSGSL